VNAETKPRSYGVAPPQFRLPDATRLGPVSLLVSNLERAIEYHHHLGTNVWFTGPCSWC